MNKSITFIFALIALLICAESSVAQVGNCEAGVAESELNINNVRARILNNGGLFWKGSPHVYEVPKYGRKNAVFAAGIWVGGYVNDEIRMAASRYGPWEFWPGPLDDQGNPPDDCTAFDRIYSVYQRDIDEYEKTGIASDDLREWPWELGAPVIDADNNPNNYNLEGGDRPEMIGHQTIWWVMNDRGNTHEATGSDFFNLVSVPVGLEVQVTAFASVSTNIHINNATLYRFKVIYKGATPLIDARFGLYQDVDLGRFDDDYVGSDSTLGMGYTYNSDNDDNGGEGYGIAPPAVGFDVIQGPLVDTDNLDSDQDGMVDEEGERLSMTAFMNYFGGGGRIGDPNIPKDYYNYMSGIWKDDVPVTVGGNGRDFSEVSTTFMHAGDPVTGEGWTELTPDPFNGTLDPLRPADRRSVVSTGPFTMQPGDSQEITYAIVWARGASNLDSISELRKASSEVQQTYDSGFNVQMPVFEQMQSIELAAPVNNISSQPTDPVLQWTTIPHAEKYLVEWSTDQNFETSQKQEVIGVTWFKIKTQESNSTYYWRVRGINASALGPWSETWSFNTSDIAVGTAYVNFTGFMTVSNAAGPIEPPEMAVFAFNDNGFPILEGNLTPEGSYPDPERPTPGIQQSLSETTWGINAYGTGPLYNNNQRNSFVGAITAGHWNDIAIGSDSYEWRFTEQCATKVSSSVPLDGCLAYAGYMPNRIIKVPFELWNIGKLPDTSDDYRMIPRMEYDFLNEGANTVFGVNEDHEISPGRCL